MDKYEAVKRWLKAFLVPMNNNYGNIKKERYSLRYELMREENKEYLEACENNDEVEIIDALTDQLFVLLGTYAEHGVSRELLDKSFKEVLDSNFSKMEKGKPVFRKDGKIEKGSNYFKPNLKKVLYECLEG